MPPLSVGLISLIVGYVLSQFYRAFLAVLAPTLHAEIGAGADDLALSSGFWFIVFALMQIPVGWSLDRFGPARTVSWLLALGGAGGAAVFALASGPWSIHIAMILIGIGCSPVLMGSYYIFARDYPPALFGTLAGFVVGVGNLGNILGAAPLVSAIELLGWRETLWGLAAVTLAAAMAIGALVRNPASTHTSDAPRGSLSEVLRLRALWPILPLLSANYAAVASIRGLWAAPYLEQVHFADTQLIGWATLAMGLAMVVASFAIGPIARALGSLKRAVLLLNGAYAAVLAALWLYPQTPLAPAITALALIGLFGSTYPIIMAHGRSFLPTHLVGRGVTFLNMFSIGGAGIYQALSRLVYRTAETGPAAATFSTLFGFFLIPLVVGLLIYALTQEAEIQ